MIKTFKLPCLLTLINPIDVSMRANSNDRKCSQTESVLARGVKEARSYATALQQPRGDSRPYVNAF
jgi:hypothetical protein